MKHNDYLDTKCKKCGNSLNFYEDSLSLYFCFFCRRGKNTPPQSAVESCYTIKKLIELCKTPFETRTRDGFEFDLYRMEIKEGLYFFAVRRGNYERITWLSLRESTNFVGNSIIDKIIKR